MICRFLGYKQQFINRGGVMSTELAKVGPSELLRVAVDKDLDIAKLEKLMEMQTVWEAKEARKEFFKAMAEFQGLCPVIKKKKKGHNYKYAPICDIVSQAGKIITKCGLSYRFEQNAEQGMISITCIVSHLSGHSESVTMQGELDSSGSKNTIQSRASTVTYLTRYTFTGSFGIATADEDMDGRLPEEFQPAKLSEYPQDQFDKNFPKWEKAIHAEMITVDDVISKAQAKAPLTQAQENEIRGIK